MKFTIYSFSSEWQSGFHTLFSHSIIGPHTKWKCVWISLIHLLENQWKVKSYPHWSRIHGLSFSQCLVWSVVFASKLGNCNCNCLYLVNVKTGCFFKDLNKSQLVITKTDHHLLLTSHDWLFWVIENTQYCCLQLFWHFSQNWFFSAKLVSIVSH